MKHPISNSQSGFTLVELAIVTLIIGFLLAGTLAMLRPYLKSAQLNATRAKLETISFALADFAQQHGRLPCPAQPLGNARRRRTVRRPPGQRYNGRQCRGALRYKTVSPAVAR
jgi:prepilin-type N-terminal cleavage/methylation domain-containing protein